MTFLQAIIHHLRTTSAPGKLVTVKEIGTSKDVTKFWFWKMRLAFLSRTGLLIRGVWPDDEGQSTDAYGLVPHLNTCVLAGHSFVPRPAGENRFLGAELCEFCGHDTVLSPLLEEEGKRHEGDRHHFFALIDPHWGELKIVTATIRETEDDVWAAAIMNPDLSLYSDYSKFPLPDGTPGNADKLKAAGFKVMKVAITFENPSPARP